MDSGLLTPLSSLHVKPPGLFEPFFFFFPALKTASGLAAPSLTQRNMKRVRDGFYKEMCSQRRLSIINSSLSIIIILGQASCVEWTPGSQNLKSIFAKGGLTALKTGAAEGRGGDLRCGCSLLPT